MKIGDYVTNKPGTIRGRVIIVSDTLITIGNLYGPSENGIPIYNEWGDPIKAGYRFGTITSKPDELRVMKGPAED